MDSKIIQTTENTKIFAQEESSIEKNPLVKVESFLMAYLHLKEVKTF